MHRPLSILVLLLLPILAGCSDTKEPNGPAFGLGLDTSNPPLPGPFLENETDLLRLERFIRQWGPGALEYCGTSNTSGLDFYTEGRFYLNALDIVFDVCQHEGDDSMEQGRQDHDAGVAGQRISEIRQEQRAILDGLIAEVSALPWPGNQVDVQVLAWLMRRIEWQESVLEGISRRLEAEYMADPTRDRAASAYLNLLNPSEAQWVIRDFIDRYPWRSEVCQEDAAQVDFIFEDTTDRLNAVIERGATLKSEDAREMTLSSVYGRTVKDYKPKLDFFREQGWWPGALWVRMSTAYADSYWNHTSDKVLPNAEESVFLLDTYLGRFRTLTTDELYNQLLENFVLYDDGFLEDHSWVAVIALASEMQWTYDDLPCHA